MNKNQILNNIINGLMEIPLPKDGKTVGVGSYKKDIQIAFKIVRQIQFSDSLKEMQKLYLKFREHIDYCLNKDN